MTSSVASGSIVTRSLQGRRRGARGWLTFLSPTVAAHLKPDNLVPSIFGEAVLTVWLLTKGVNVEL